MYWLFSNYNTHFASTFTDNFSSTPNPLSLSTHLVLDAIRSTVANTEYTRKVKLHKFTPAEISSKVTEGLRISSLALTSVTTVSDFLKHGVQWNQRAALNRRESGIRKPTNNLQL